jgi:hypothetical protein
MNNEIKLYAWFGITGIICLITLAVSPAKDYFKEWKRYQKMFYEKVQMGNSHIAVKQIVIEELGKVDRCVTCHMGVEDPNLKTEENPFKYHSADPGRHPFERFGCTICHEGQGRATTVRDGHGYNKHWEKPMLPLDYTQASCGKCHFETELKGANLLTEGRRLYKEKSCDLCHKIGGIGESVGPEITYEGSKTIDDFNFGNVRDIERTPWAWHFAHFKNPQLFDPNSQMPNLELSDEEAKALTVYMLSLTKEKIPYEYRRGM